MSANLSPEYIKAENEFKAAQTPHERLSALKRMLSTIPKHKGTEKLQGDIKRRIAQTKEEVQTSGKKKGFSYAVRKEGAAQVVLAGPPNVGKSSLVAALTNARPEVATYPFTTRLPEPAMMDYADIQIQLVDLPPVSSEHMEPWVPNIIRNGDAILFLVDLSDPDLLDEIETTTEILKKHKVELVREHISPDPWASVVKVQTWLIGNKSDQPDADDNWQILKELYESQYFTMAVSLKSANSVEHLRKEIYTQLDLCRVYSKLPHKPPEMDHPFVFRRGSTLHDLAISVHKDFGEKLKFARVWGKDKFDGQRINKEYILNDGDVIELHL